MDFFGPATGLSLHDMGTDCSYNPVLTEALTLAHVSQGIDPLHAALEA